MLKNDSKAIALCIGLLYSLGCSSAIPQGNTAINNKEPNCKISRLKNSQKIIESILEDLNQNYDHVGGEISDIRLSATNVYEVSISQEERTDLLTYHMAVSASCDVNVVKKDISSKALSE